LIDVKKLKPNSQLVTRYTKTFAGCLFQTIGIELGERSPSEISGQSQ